MDPTTAGPTARFGGRPSGGPPGGLRLDRVLRLLLLIGLALGLVGCDHATKFAAKVTLEGHDALPVAPQVLDRAVELRYVQNDDIAFSLFHRLGILPSAPILAVISTLAVALIIMSIVLAARRKNAG